MKTAAAFVLGFAAGMACLAVVLWRTGSLQSAQVQAARAVPEKIQFQDPQINLGERKQPPTIPPPFPTAANPAAAPGAASAGPSLGMPIAGVDPHTLRSNFSETHGGHAHEALDIMAPRGTPAQARAGRNVATILTTPPSAPPA